MKLFFRFPLCFVAVLPLICFCKTESSYEFYKFQDEKIIRLKKGLPKEFEFASKVGVRLILKAFEVIPLKISTRSYYPRPYGSEYFFVQLIGSSGKFWVKKTWLSEGSQAKLERHRKFNAIKLNQIQDAKKLWNQRDAFGDPPEPTPIVVAHRYGVFENNETLSMSIRTGYPIVDHFKINNPYELKWVAYPAIDLNSGPNPFSHPREPEPNYSLSHSQKNMLVGLKNDLGEIELISAAWLSDSSFSHLEENYELYTPGNRDKFEALWNKTHISFGIPPSKGNTILSDFNYRMVPFERGNYISSSSLKEETMIVRTQDEFDELRNILDAGESTRILKLYKFDSQKHTILGIQNHYLCDPNVSREFVRDDTKKKIEFSVQSLQFICISGSPERTLELIEVDRIQDDYTVNLFINPDKPENPIFRKKKRLKIKFRVKKQKINNTNVVPIKLMILRYLHYLTGS